MAQSCLLFVNLRVANLRPRLPQPREARLIWQGRDDLLAVRAASCARTGSLDQAGIVRLVFR
jgi:hypothetical protein